MISLFVIAEEGKGKQNVKPSFEDGPEYWGQRKTY